MSLEMVITTPKESHSHLTLSGLKTLTGLKKMATCQRASFDKLS